MHCTQTLGLESGTFASSHSHRTKICDSSNMVCVKCLFWIVPQALRKRAHFWGNAADHLFQLGHAYVTVPDAAIACASDSGLANHSPLPDA